MAWAAGLLGLTVDAAALNNGELKIGYYPYAPGIDGPSKQGDVFGCTGVLVTPRWVLTAGHCLKGVDASCLPIIGGAFDEPGWDMTQLGAIEVHFADNVDEAEVADVYGVDDYAVLSSGKLDVCSQSSRARDMALLHLDRRVPLAVANPRHPPLLEEPGCASTVQDTTVGYGGNLLLVPDASQRRAVTGGLWWRVDDGNAAVYHTDWEIPIVPGQIMPLPQGNLFVDPAVLLTIQASYYGMNGGDSGGPLLDESERLCGVGSAPTVSIEFFPILLPPFVVATLEIGNDYPAVGSLAAKSFMKPEIVVTGTDNPKINDWFEGECAPPLQGADNDNDHDNIPEACDNCPRQYCQAHPTQFCNDGDDYECVPECVDESQSNTDLAAEQYWGDTELGDACDPCPTGANMSLGDDDDCPDACDPCPDDTGYGAWGVDRFDRCGDADGDGICNSLDTCPFVASDPTRNANLLSELYHPSPAGPEFVHLGDACDPVPVPRAWSVPQPTECVVPALFCEAFDHSTIQVRALASHPGNLGTTLAVPQPAGLAKTPVRFCQDQETDTFKIDCDSKEGITDYWLDANDCAPPTANPKCQDLEQPEDYYHRVTFKTALQGNGKNPNGLDDILWYDQYDPAWTSMVGPNQVPFSAEWRWTYQLDYERWIATSMFLLGAEPAKAEDLSGVLWLHARTDIGNTDLTKNTGYHGPELANQHLADFRPHVESTNIHKYDKTLAKWLATEAYDPKPVFPPDPAPFRRPDRSVGQKDILLCPEGDAFGWVAMVGNGASATDVTPWLGTALRGRLADPALRIVPAAEPFLMQGAGPSFPLGLFVNAEGGDQIVDRIVAVHGRLYADADRGEPGPEPRTGSPHARGFHAVLSRTRRGLFVVGGEDLVTGLPTGQVWLTLLDTPVWLELVSEPRPARVLAATYSWASRKLYFLDEAWLVPTLAPPKPKKTRLCHRPPGNDAQAHTIEVGDSAVGAHLGHGDSLGACPELVARLVAVSLDPPGSTLLGSWPRNPAWERQELVVDRDGALLLASSAPCLGEHGRHAIARIDVASFDALAVDGITAGPRSLAIPPVVESAGYALVFEQYQGEGAPGGACGGGKDDKAKGKKKGKSKGTSPIELVRTPALDLVPGSVADLGKQL